MGEGTQRPADYRAAHGPALLCMAQVGCEDLLTAMLIMQYEWKMSPRGLLQPACSTSSHNMQIYGDRWERKRNGAA